MSLINKRYANYYNTKNCLTGHVFEKRYYDKLIDSPKGLLEVSRYIHLNPVDAKMVRFPHHYRWSSYLYYSKKLPIQHDFVNLHPILDLFQGSDGREKGEVLQVCVRGKRCRGTKGDDIVVDFYARKVSQANEHKGY